MCVVYVKSAKIIRVAIIDSETVVVKDAIIDIHQKFNTVYWARM